MQATQNFPKPDHVVARLMGLHGTPLMRRAALDQYAFAENLVEAFYSLMSAISPRRPFAQTTLVAERA